MIYTRTIMKLLFCVAAVTAAKRKAGLKPQYDVLTPDGIYLPRPVEQLIVGSLHPMDRLYNARNFITIKDCELHSFNGKYYQASYKELVATYDIVMGDDFEMPKKTKEFLTNLKSKMECEQGFGATFDDIIYIAPPVENIRDSYRLIINELERPTLFNEPTVWKIEGMRTKLVTCGLVSEICDGETMQDTVHSWMRAQADNWFTVWRQYHSNYEKSTINRKGEEEKNMITVKGVNGSGFAITMGKWMAYRDQQFKGYEPRIKEGTCGKFIPSNLKFEARRMNNKEYSRYLKTEKKNGRRRAKTEYQRIGQCPWAPLEYSGSESQPAGDSSTQSFNLDDLEYIKFSDKSECDDMEGCQRRRLASAEAWFNDQ